MVTYCRGGRQSDDRSNFRILLVSSLFMYQSFSLSIRWRKFLHKYMFWWQMINFSSRLLGSMGESLSPLNSPFGFCPFSAKNSSYQTLMEGQPSTTPSWTSLSLRYSNNLTFLSLEIDSLTDNYIFSFFWKKLVPIENFNGRKRVEAGDLCERRNG